jgi:hypothetical protein
MTNTVVAIAEDVVHTVQVAVEADTLVEVLQDTLVSVVVQESVQVVTATQQGPAGPPGGGGGGTAEFVQPHFVYANGVLQRVEYADGRWKAFEFSPALVLMWVDIFDGTRVQRRTLVRDVQGRLVDVVQSEVS